MANDLIAKPGTPVAIRIAEVQAAPAHKVKDLATHVYKKPDGTALMTYYEALQRPRQEVIDAIIAFEVATGVVVNDGSPVAAPAPAPAPTPVAAPPAPQAAAWTPAPTPAPVAVQPQVGQVPPTALEPVQTPRPSRRSQAKAAQTAAPAPAPTPVAAPVEAAPAPTPVVAAPAPAPIPTPVPPAPVAVIPPSAPVFAPPSAPAAFVPPTPAPVVTKSEQVDLGPLVARLDKTMASVVNLDAKTDHMMFVLYHLFSGMYGQTVQQNNIKTFSDFKKYIQAISTPQ